MKVCKSKFEFENVKNVSCLTPRVIAGVNLIKVTYA